MLLKAQVKEQAGEGEQAAWLKPRDLLWPRQCQLFWIPRQASRYFQSWVRQSGRAP